MFDPDVDEGEEPNYRFAEIPIDGEEEEEIIYRHLPAAEDDLDLEPGGWDDGAEMWLKGTSLKACAPITPPRRGSWAMMAAQQDSSRLSQGSSSSGVPVGGGASDENGTEAEPGDEDMDALLRTWAELRVGNAQLEAECSHTADALQQLGDVNEAMSATLRPGQRPAASGRLAAGQRRPSGGGQTYGSSIPPPVPELSMAKRPRSFTSEVAAEPLHPHKQQSDRDGRPQSGPLTAEQLREQIDDQRRLREQLQKQVHENAEQLSALAKTNAELRQ